MRSWYGFAMKFESIFEYLIFLGEYCECILILAMNPSFIVLLTPVDMLSELVEQIDSMVVDA